MATNPAVRTGKTIQLWPEQLQENKANHRYDFGDINALAASILTYGIKQPLIVQKTKDKTDDNYPIYKVLIGNRRTRAAKKIADKMEEGDFVPAIAVPDDYTMEQAIADSIITDYHSKSRNMLELAYDMKVLVDGGKKQNALAKELGMSAQYVTDALFLVTTATEDILSQVKKGLLTPYQAIDLLRANPVEEVEEIVSKATKTKGKKDAEEHVINPDKKANTKTALKKSELKEAAAGKPISLKDKKSKSAVETSVTQAGGDTKKKEDPTLAKIVQLKDTLKANAGKQIVPAFNALIGIIKYLKGTMSALELSEYFFEEEEEATPAKKPAKGKEKPVSAAEVKTKGKAKKSAEPEPEDEELGEDLPEDNDEPWEE